MVPYIGALAARRGWATKEEFAEGVALCQSIPGATAMQTAAFVGLRAGGVRGAAAAYVGFGLPAVLLMSVASAAYVRMGSIVGVQATFGLLRAMIVALIANAAFTFTRNHGRSLPDAIVAVGCAAAFFVGFSPILVIASAALLEIVVRRDAADDPGSTARPFAPGSSRAAVAVLFTGLGLALLLLAAAPRLGALALEFMKIDLLAFGGGFAAIPLMLREAVEVHRWVDARSFMDGIALGQVTPGPIVVTATFVGYLASGIAGALVASVAVFLPSFALVVGLAPWFGWLRIRPRFAPALHGALLSFVGLLLSTVVQLGRAVDWGIVPALLATGSFVALRAGVDVLWVVVAFAGVAVVLL
jgi:chromate transporter